jgi:WD40 repeat protein/tRNA A-37 threonylcarbamoyl transferase component Bud32
VEALLRADARAGSFLESPPAGAGVTIGQPARIDGPGTAIGRYELLELIGEGGMGLVYLAEQKEPVKRRVALKIIKPGMDSKQVIARFEAERQALAVLDHPNIAHVFDAGCTETGRPYFVMEHVKGMSITRYCDDKKLTIEQRLRLFEQVCEGVQHAHQKGIIHRDLKPSNILVTMQGDRPVPKIIDFGIAKATTQALTDATVFTYQGQLLGTPEYMSPEQVDLATQDIDTRSDIYSLGVVLYELLAGVLPFESESFTKVGLAEIQRTIREDEPASPSIRLTQMGDKARGIAESRGTHVVPLARRLHRELEWIPLKAMRKDRCRRYKSASDMADDIRNYLNGNPLLAGPETTIYRVQKFVRKHAGSVATVALVAVAIVLGLVVSTAMYFRAEEARQKEVAARTQAEQAEETTKTKAGELRRTLYVNSVQLADAKRREGNARQARSLLDACPEDLRGWEWHHLDYISDESILTITQAQRGASFVVFSPDGKRIAAGGADGSIKMWDAASGAELVTLSGHGGPVSSLAFSPDGKGLVSGSSDKTAKLWDAKSGAESMTLRGHDKEVLDVAFSPDGKRVASSAYDETIKIWDAATGAEVMTLKEVRHVGRIAFSPDGKYVSAASENKVRTWDANSGVEAMTISAANSDWTACVAYSPDGERIVSCGGWDSRIKVWDTSTGTEVLRINSHQREALHFVAFSADGKRILSAGRDSVIKVWDARTGDEMRALRGHKADAPQATFSPDGRRIVSCGRDGMIKVWSMDLEHEPVTLRGHKDWTNSVAFSPDGRRVAASGSEIIKVWDVAAGAEVMTLRGHEKWIGDLAFSPDGKRIVSRGSDRKVRVWDISNAGEVLSFQAHSDYVRAVAFSPDGNLIASGGGDMDRTIRIWDALTGENISTLHGHTGEVMSVAFSPDGKRLLSGGCPVGAGEDGVRLWNVKTGSELIKCDHGVGVFSVAYSPDGRYVASGGSDGDRTIKVWNADSGSEVMTLQGHEKGVTSVAFSPDGKRILSGSRDETVRLWDAATGTEVMALPAQRAVWSAVFSPDGKTIAITDGNNVTLFESAPPLGGYGQRQTAQEARGIVDRWHSELGFYHEVINGLQVDKVLDEPVRGFALRIANCRKWEDAEKLRSDAWQAINSPDKGIEAYRTALEKAEKADGWESNDPAILGTLGAAQYRTGVYEEALKTFEKAEKLRANEGGEPDRAAVAFTAMVLHKLGRTEEAKAAVGKVRTLLKDGRLADAERLADDEAKALLVEAEGLIEGKKP